MGCDIHTIIEYRGTKWNGEAHVDAGWVKSKVTCFEYPYASVHRSWSNDNQPVTDVPLMGRDYDLFAMLADVRNDGNIVPIQSQDELRGVPDDASKGWRKYTGDWGSDLHSITYYTLAELQEALNQGRFRQETWEEGCLTAEQYRRLIEWGQQPTGWSADIGGGKVRLGTEEDVRGILKRKQKRIELPVDDSVPPMPGEAHIPQIVDFGGEVEPEPLSGPLLAFENSEPLKGFTHIRARWARVIDREAPIRNMLEIAKNFAPPIGERPGWGEPDTRDRDLTKVRLMIGFDN